MKKFTSLTLLGILFVSLFSCSFSSVSFASTCPTSFSSWTSPYFDALGDRLPISSFKYAVTYDNFNDWLSENSYPSSCSTTGPFAYYQNLVNQTAGHSAAQVQDAFSTKISICLKGQSLSIFNLGSLIAWSKCVINVAFVPTSTVLNQDLHTVQNSINTHAPLAYASVGISFFNQIKKNWASTSCTQGTLGISTNLPDSVDGSNSIPLVVALDCRPPASMRFIRQFGVIAVYSLLVFFCWEIYKRGILILNGTGR